MKTRIKQIAKQKGVTYKQIAASLGISEQGFKNLLQKNNPTVATLYKIADALGVSVACFFADDAPTLPTAGGSSAGSSSAGSISCPWCGSPLSLQVGKGNKVTKDDAAKTKDK